MNLFFNNMYSLLIWRSIPQLRFQPASLTPDSFRAEPCRVQRPGRDLSHVALATRLDPARRPRDPTNAFSPEDPISYLRERTAPSDCLSSVASRVIGVPSTTHNTT